MVLSGLAEERLSLDFGSPLDDCNQLHQIKTFCINNRGKIKLAGVKPILCLVWAKSAICYGLWKALAVLVDIRKLDQC